MSEARSEHSPFSKSLTVVTRKLASDSDSVVTAAASRFSVSGSNLSVLVAGYRNGSIRLFASDSPAQEISARAKGSDKAQPVTALALNADLDALAVATEGSAEILVFKIDRNARTGGLYLHSRPFEVLSKGDAYVKLSETTDGHGKAVSCLHFSNTYRSLLISGGQDSTIRFWSIREDSDSSMSSFNGTKLDSRSLRRVGMDNQIRNLHVCRVENSKKVPGGRNMSVSDDDGDGVPFLAVYPVRIFEDQKLNSGGSRFFVGVSDGSVQVFDHTQSRPLAVFSAGRPKNPALPSGFSGKDKTPNKNQVGAAQVSLFDLENVSASVFSLYFIQEGLLVGYCGITRTLFASLFDPKRIQAAVKEASIHVEELRNSVVAISNSHEGKENDQENDQEDDQENDQEDDQQNEQDREGGTSDLGIRSISKPVALESDPSSQSVLGRVRISAVDATARCREFTLSILDRQSKIELSLDCVKGPHHTEGEPSTEGVSTTNTSTISTNLASACSGAPVFVESLDMDGDFLSLGFVFLTPDGNLSVTCASGESLVSASRLADDLLRPSSDLSEKRKKTGSLGDVNGASNVSSAEPQGIMTYDQLIDSGDFRENFRGELKIVSEKDRKLGFSGIARDRLSKASSTGSIQDLGSTYASSLVSDEHGLDTSTATSHCPKCGLKLCTCGFMSRKVNFKSFQSTGSGGLKRSRHD